MADESTGRRRVLLKLSGEAFGGGQLGVNPDVVSQMAREIAAAVDEVEIAVVVGGGNFFRGAELSQRGMDRGRADYMGMLGTVMNALALQDFLEQAGAATRVQSAISNTSDCSGSCQVAKSRSAVLPTSVAGKHNSVPPSST